MLALEAPGVKREFAPPDGMGERFISQQLFSGVEIQINVPDVRNSAD